MEKHVVVAVVGLALSTSSALADDAGASTKHPFFREGSVVVGLDAAGALLFRDVPDGTIERTTTNAYGAHIAGMIHDEATDAHRYGIAMGVASAARSATRSLTLLTPRLVYETGFPFVLDVALGGAVPLGKGGLEEGQAGVLGELGLRWALQGADSKLTVSPGLDAMMIVDPTTPEAASAWLGARVQLAYHPTR